MKLICLITFLCVTVSNAFLLDLFESEITKAPQSIVEYKTAVFAQFNLKAPSQIINCFDQRSTYLYFKRLRAVQEVSHATEKRQHVKVHLLWAKLILLQKGLNRLDKCIVATQDFKDLLNALGVKNAKYFVVAHYVYFQSNFATLDQELAKVLKNLQARNWKAAGSQGGELTKRVFSEMKSRGWALQLLNGFWNGVHITLGLPDAESVFGCWDDSSAATRVQFIYGMAEAVAKGAPNEASKNTQKWYQEKGNDLIKKIPEARWKCWKDSKDTKAESQKLGIDIMSREFWGKIRKFVDGNQPAYYKLQVELKRAFDQYNLHHAGGAYAAIWKAAAAQK